MRAPRWLIRGWRRIFPAGSAPGWGLLFAGLCAILFWHRREVRIQRAHSTARWQSEAEHIALQLRRRLGEFELTLQGLRGFYEGSNSVEREEFDRYCKTTDPLHRLPGLLTINTARRVSAAEAAGLPVWSEENGPGRAPPPRPFYFPITYRHPDAPAMIGFDAGSSPEFAAAIGAAAQRDGLAVSEPAVFTNAAGEKNAGFIMLVPYYTGGKSHSDPPEGFIELVVGAARLLDGIVSPDDRENLHLVLRTGGANPQEAPLLETGDEADFSIPAWRQEIPFGNRVWILTAGASSARGGAPAPLAFYLAGLAVVLLAGLVAGLGMGRDRAHAAAAALRASEQRARGLMDANLIGIFFTGADGRLLEANAAFLHLLGCTREALGAGQIDLMALTPPEHQERTRQAEAELLQTGETKPFEKDYFRSDGTRITVLAGAARIAAEGEEFATFVLDLTASKKTEAALRDNEERLRLATDAAQVGTWDWNVATGEVRWSASVEPMFGYEPGAFDGTYAAYLACIPEADRPPLEASIQRAMSGDSRYEVEHRVRWPDGAERWMAGRGEVIRDEAGRPLRMVGTVTDITERKRAQLRLAESEEKYRDLFAFAPIGIYRSAPDGRILAANQTLAALLGYDHAEALIGRDMANEIYQDARERDRLIARYEPGGGAARLEVEFRRRNSAPLWVQLDAHAIKDAQGRTRYFEGFVHDIDARKRAEAALESTRAAHEKRNALLLAIARSPALTGDLPSILNAVTEAAAAGLGCARSSVWFFSESGVAECAGRYLAAESRHAPGGTLRAHDHPEYFRALAKGAPLAIDDLGRDPRTANFAAAYLAPLGITASLVAPLRAGGALAGMLTCDHAGGPRAWTPEEQGFLSALGDLMVLARETGERRRAEAQLRLLNEDLEERVAARTAALARSNAELAVEAGERRRTLEELRSSAALLTAVTEGTTDAIYVKDLGGRYLFINGAGAQFMGLDAGRIIGRSDAEIYSPENTAAQTARDRNVLDLGRTQTFDDVSESGGGRRIMLATKGVIRDAGGEITGLFGISRDITTRREQEADLERLNHSLKDRHVELEALNEELETFSYSVSHDLRAPLRAIDGFSQALVEDFGGPLGVDGKNLLDRVRGGAKQMGQLIDGLLQLSRASRGVLRREPLDLSALAQAVVHDLQAGDPGRRQSVSIEPGLQAEGDPALLRAVLQNLLGNAWKFTAGAPAAEIHFARADARHLRGFAVRDTGAGFDPAYAGKLFQPFQRLHRASDFPGTGIGLATVKRIIRRHSGRVWAESEPGRGAAFYFTLWDASGDLPEEKIEG